MNKRIVEIIQFLLKQKTTITFLSEKYHVSERTIRNDIGVINDILQKNHLQKLQLGANGKIICSDDFSNILEYLPEDDFYSYKLSKEERKWITSSLFVHATEYITLSMIAEHLSVSRATIISDLDGVKSFLKENGLTVLSYSNKGLRIEGLESDKRKLLLKIAEYEWSLSQSKSVKLLGIQAGNIVTIQKILNEQEHAHGYFLTDVSFQRVLTYIRLMIQRNQQGEYIEKMTEHVSDKYRMAQDILKYVTQYCENTSTENEIIFLTKILDECKYIKRKVNENSMVKIQLMTRRFIEAISEEMGVHLNEDYDFYENLSNHLGSVFQNKNANLTVGAIHQEVVQKNKSVWEAVQQHKMILESGVERTLTDAEKTYIVIHICAALERKKNQDIAFHVILVCHAGIGTSQLLLARLKQHFKFRIVDIISAHEVANITADQADLLITTVELEATPIPYVKVSPLMNDEDYVRVGAKIDALRNTLQLPVREEKKEITTKAVLRQIKPILYESVPEYAPKLMEQITKKLMGYFRMVNSEEEAQMFSPSLHHLLPEMYIQTDVKADTWQEAVSASAQNLLEKRYIEEKYIQAMIDNIEENGPYILLAPWFALPHEGIDRGTMKIGMNLIRLQKPVKFDDEGDPVSFVCCLSAVDHKTHLKALFHLVNMLQYEGFQEAMEQAKTSQDIAKVIEQYEYEANEN